MKDTRARLFEAAIRLFAEKGYRETSIGQIEEEAGLAPRAGGFYRHFKTKEDLLVEALELHIEEVEEDLAFTRVLPLGDTRAELLLIGRTILQAAEKHRDLRKIIRREGRHIRQIRQMASSIAQQDGFKDLLPWVKDKLGRSGAGDQDPRVTAVNVFGPVFFILFLEEQGDQPLHLSREEFLSGWADQWAHVLECGFS